MKTIIKSFCENSTERGISKAFARFIISSKTLGNETHSVIPEFVHSETVRKFEQELKEISPNVDIPCMHEELLKTRDEYIQKMQSDKGRFHVSNSKNEVIIEYGYDRNKKSKFTTEIPNHIYDKLTQQCENKIDATKYIFCAWVRYLDIICGGMDATQWCCSEDIFMILINEFKCKIELFASPMNCHPNIIAYGSLFHDTDRHFGSLGNYQGIISEKRLSGIMHANPPPIEAVQNDFINRAIAEMSLEDRVLGFFAMLSYWSDAQYYKTATTSVFCRRVILSSMYQNDLDHVDLAEAYFTSFSPLLDKDIPMPSNDRAVIIILANETLWNQDRFQDLVAEHFPNPSL